MFHDFSPLSANFLLFAANQLQEKDHIRCGIFSGDKNIDTKWCKFQMLAVSQKSGDCRKTYHAAHVH